ncbi:NAD(P)/FAD-dependent oxidoreductase [Denitromonas ohlonensis]|uniref:FAD-dependent oxidoreductase n=2 Tax=Denitromonas TaxID=139331 RepID=A0A557SFJ2_9RHOO|nr:FAD-dependent oxidoreductase [Denitromonas ohlonensis]TVO63256.1 FAD-dependent oxidoreductase [Denitromonas ohlonensis]TVO76197.1 FAD-dependent oxidoreductase [Denitromonas ohlonensis]
MDMTEQNRFTPPPGQKIAVIGGGISGLATAWLLRKTHQVTLFEAADYMGGHTNTVDVELDGQVAAVDTGFLVFNQRTYPNLCALFAQLGVESVASEMSFSVSLSDPDMEWSGTSLATLFGQPRNAVRPAFWRMVADIVRFNREASAMAVSAQASSDSLGHYLDTHGYGQAFRDWYLLPMAAAIWSCPTRTMLAYPVSTFVRFCLNHGLLQIQNRPQWLTVAGGAKRYVARMVADLDDVRLASPVGRVVRSLRGVRVHTPQGVEDFDGVVLACHSDQALAMLGRQVTRAEASVLGAVRYQPNVAWLHTDRALLPRREALWSAWNYMAGAVPSDGDAPVSVSYLINKLQPLPFARPVVVSLNPYRAPRDEHVIKRIEYAHPVFDQLAIEAQGWLPAVQGQHRTWFAGAWQGYGFHEDGLRSAMDVARRLGAEIPWGAPADAPVALSA